MVSLLISNLIEEIQEPSVDILCCFFVLTLLAYFFEGVQQKDILHFKQALSASAGRFRMTFLGCLLFGPKQGRI